MYVLRHLCRGVPGTGNRTKRRADTLDRCSGRAKESRSVMFPWTFVLLAALAIAGAGGVLLFREVTRCCVSFLVCCLALAGLYLVLNLRFVAVTQLIANVCLAGLYAWAILPSGKPSTRRDPILVPAMVGGALLLAAAWAIGHAVLGEPVPGSLPIWATPYTHAVALGKEMIEKYAIPFLLTGLLLLVGIVSVTYSVYEKNQEGET
jgi:NADH:ubiquinone oxidoreductase subunit 6 (subunit J)